MCGYWSMFRLWTTTQSIWLCPKWYDIGKLFYLSNLSVLCLFSWLISSIQCKTKQKLCVVTLLIFCYSAILCVCDFPCTCLFYRNSCSCSMFWSLQSWPSFSYSLFSIKWIDFRMIYCGLHQTNEYWSYLCEVTLYLY
jgi:hypothetical protein